MKLPSRYKETGAKLSSGGMSSVVVCTDTHLDRPVLVKQLQDGIEQSRLLDEIAALSSIRSKYVVQIYDVLRDKYGNIEALIEEYLPGEDLNTIAPITDAGRFIQIAYVIACGIADIHGRGHVHRDIKPNNMKFDGEGCIKIFDFGLSRPDDVHARTVGTVGTVGYIAPELCPKDEHDEVVFSQPVDVYAYGATALKLLRGSLPNPLRRVPPDLPCAAADFAAQITKIPQDVASLLNSCLEADPTDRPSIADMRDVLAAHLLRDTHRATLVVGNTIHILDSANRQVSVNGRLGSVIIEYDGLKFDIISISGTVTVNNLHVKTPFQLPGSCVIILGDISQGQRQYVTVDVSHPEVVL